MMHSRALRGKSGRSRPVRQGVWLNTMGQGLNARPPAPKADSTAWSRSRLQGMARKIYRPGMFSGRVVVLAGDELPTRRKRTADSWAALAQGQLVLQMVPGDHDHLLDERYASGLAEYIQGVVEHTHRSSTP